jgi:peroxidase
LDEYNDFIDLTGGDTELASNFASVYDSIHDVDLWIGGLAEAHIDGGVLGETFHAIVADQFIRSRDGDRYFYQAFVDDLILIDSQFESTLLSDIILRNSDIAVIQSDVFKTVAVVPEPSTLGLLMVAWSVVLLRRKRGR